MSTFRRCVEIVCRGNGASGEVRAALEDDFHHFRVKANYHDGVLRQIEGEALRIPYTACAQAMDQVHLLLGMSITRIAHSVTRQTDPQHQCTHLLDLAGLAIASAARGTSERRYAIQVPQRVDKRTRPTLERDGEQLLVWNVQGMSIKGPAPFVDIDLREGMARWALNHLPEELAEAALLLRRCTLISMGRMYDLDAQEHASSTGRCFSQQPQRAVHALRMKGSTWDFSAAQGRLCAGDQAWLAECGRPLPGPLPG
ncbi:DUF2889 domain-containing protein [Pseudomonas typographi]|uniref:DUF2889 domain-containing protein n=1 Tax=Pseudomonas typographi TaxID=2715964 RepID=UPI001684287E|nr:DUF2889 domain-containing protein [Pseudomonas typographi]MBD1555046.1 DUF2889 domain-containing protein [Pseudomonas typographi]